MGNTPSSRPSSSSRYQFDPTLDAKGPEDTVNAGKSDTKAGPDNTRVPLDPPPPYYTEAVSSTLGSSSSSSDHRNDEYLRAPMRADTAENALQILRKYDTVLIIDDSGSMLGSKWRQAEKSLAALADMAGKYDTDGIDVAFLNSTKVGEGIRSGKEVQRLFLDVRPFGHTPIGERLESLLLTYLARIEGAQRQGVLNTIKPVNYVIITDGEPTDDPESVILSAAQRLDRGNFPLTQVGIQLLQIGKDVAAAEYLKQLDDDLHKTHNIRDIVDTTPFQATKGEVTADLITKILIGGINRRVDRKGVAARVVS
ncbi:hypothetical protein PC9H_004762 [Pleurotus ostreatus]|uniref:VWFA domain-containing protein n=1 Tax=Pleurotus ostreatus TaxID=5322 RepID=A0A8H7DTS7_PLEOS|nr:uncharacterized protein PC9H_004762 [Pleurotus ostreatus]KAF7432819.1 hypothetical protein PC9H_004762 [Pleurotus ostreatus]KAJ8698627.1 hypothetical protein PTI98_005315 [Pleurotus ostreatus]